MKQFFGLSPGVMRGCVQEKQFDLVSPISFASLFQPALLNAIKFALLRCGFRILNLMIVRARLWSATVARVFVAQSVHS